MSLIPGWDSIANAGWWSGVFFWASIVSLIGLGISEIASHRYSERKDELVAAQQLQDKKRHDDEIARLHGETAKTIERAAQLEKEAAALRLGLEKEHDRVSDRMLKDGQRKMLTDAAYPPFTKSTGVPAGFKGALLPFDIAYLDGDREAEDLAFRVYTAVPALVKARIRLPIYEFPKFPSGIAVFDPEGENGNFAETMKRVFPDSEFLEHEWLFTPNKTGHRTLYIWRKPL